MSPQLTPQAFRAPDTGRGQDEMRFLLAAILVLILLAGGVCLADETAPVPMKDEKRIVAAITTEFVAVDVVRNGGVKFPAFRNQLDPLTRFEFRPALGKPQWFDTKGGTTIPDDYFAGDRFYLEGAKVGEAVLIKITSEVFPWDRKTYVTYNAATEGNFSGGELIAATPPPYYNTVPVDGDFLMRGEANPGYSGARLYPVFCDSYTSPSIAVRPFGDETRFVIKEGNTALRVEFPSTGEVFTAEFPPVPADSDSFLSYAFYWGPSGSTGYRDAYFGQTIPADGNALYSAQIEWHSLSFRTVPLNTLVSVGWYDNIYPPRCQQPWGRSEHSELVDRSYIRTASDSSS